MLQKFSFVRSYLGKKSIVDQLHPSNKWISCYVVVVVVCVNTIFDQFQHICADNWIVCVAADFTATDKSKEWQSECVSHGIDVNIRLKLPKCFQSQNHGAQTLAEHRETRISFSLDPFATIQKHKSHIFLVDGDIESISCFLQDFLRFHIRVAGVNCNVNLVVVPNKQKNHVNTNSNSDKIKCITRFASFSLHTTTHAHRHRLHCNTDERMPLDIDDRRSSETFVFYFAHGIAMPILPRQVRLLL